MENEFLYMLAVVAVGFILNYGLRALPFILMGARTRPLSPRVSRLSRLVSPVIIAALVLYSYSGLAWKTPWPYLAGVLTIGLQLWRRNALTSIVAGTALYMCLLSFCGCYSTRVLKLDREHPFITLTDRGLEFAGRPTAAEDIPRLLRKHQVSTDATIYIRVPNDFTRKEALWHFQNSVLRRAGYTRSMQVFPEKSESHSEMQDYINQGNDPRTYRYRDELQRIESNSRTPPPVRGGRR